LPGVPQCIYNPPVSRVSALYRLQQIDSNIDQAETRLAEIETELAADQAVQAARSRAHKALAAQREAAVEGRAAEEALATQRRKLEETEARLYGGSVQNPKALQELQAEVEALRRHQATLEDRALEALARIEQADQEAAASQTALELAEAEAAGRSQSLLRERQALTESLAQRSIEREAALSGIEAEALHMYQSLRQGGRSLAVVVLLDGSCQACGLTLSAAERQEVRGGSALVRCHQCGRILYAG
jgi:hypothetical protein